MLNAGGMGAMGFGLPAAIGASFAAQDRRINLLSGDGGMQVNIQELQTVVRWRLPLTLFVLNNRSLGMVRQFQNLYFGGRLASTVDGYSCPDFIRVAIAYGIRGIGVANWHELTSDSTTESLMQNNDPLLIEIALSVHAAVHPKLGVNRPIEDMEPLLEREELRDLLFNPLIEG